ncbi:MAG: phospholipase D-like domain-containing protein [Rhizomicrobium sp.]|jgi:phosphatidylserine/phosphatidylglycerophosphate/cardiolipin synthase-like enzyme
MPKLRAHSQKSIDSTIQSNLGKLAKPGVLTVRPGYEIADHTLTGKSAIVATVHSKKPMRDLKRGEALPDSIAGVPVDVREASAHQRLRAIDPAAAAISHEFGRPEDRDPEWDLEREMPSGKLLTDAASDTQKKLKAASKAQPSTAAALKSKAAKKKVDYYPPKSCPVLEPMQVTTSITTAISPDCGFATLTDFLKATRKSLVIGMYDFTSGPILGLFLDVLDSPKTLQMVLDNPAPNPTRDQIDWVTVQDLDKALGARAKIAHALAGDDRFASAKMFPTSYHIKVIVRDGDTVWLSSGNLNNSNEPDPTRPPSTEDRDWHVIVEDEDLAQLFTDYLNYDYAAAMKDQVPNPDAIGQAIEDALAKKSREANPHAPHPARPPAHPFDSKTFDNVSLAITPLLTPDKLSNGKPQYLSNIMPLIQGAQDSVHIQLQYIEASKGDGKAYDKLLQALLDKSKTATVELIVSADYADKNAEKMRASTDDGGVDLTDLIRTQPSVHNKGFVIDGKTVIVSSQNFSPDGIELNRDAGLILESQEIAGYFGAVFDADWAGTHAMSATTKTSVGRGSRSRSTGTRTKKKTTAKRKTSASHARKPRAKKKTTAKRKTPPSHARKPRAKKKKTHRRGG